MELNLIVLVSPGKTDGKGTSLTNVIHLVDGQPVFRRGVTLKHDTKFEHDYRSVYGCALGDEGEFIVINRRKFFTSPKDVGVLNCVSNKRSTQIAKLHSMTSLTDLRGLFLLVRAWSIMLAFCSESIQLKDPMHIYVGNALDQAIELYSTSECCEDISFTELIDSDYMKSVFTQALSTIKTFKTYG